PHLAAVQEIVSAEKTPTLSLVLPIYENPLLILRSPMIAQEPEKINIAINAAPRKIEEYLNLSRGTKIYSLAM
ncbi:hypothetical protein R3P38DRAFT_2413237, partial [Favolaschia claudopus]